ncbi:hypothetical protein [Bizionia paragorgiae]|jgi:hypothetical protein|uniref:hypothetical protein n=1 Tax=Bizionia paragorgiae TaxID=283786 RepID=UPI00299CF781|nr:hypothetical protein [Bizionia paragorgiae]MDX1271586.1 hypothetical protein [Bizionia paragorgiae]
MKKIRAIGFILLVVGVVLHLFVENDSIDFVTGLFMGAGFALLILGQLKRNI